VIEIDAATDKELYEKGNLHFFNYSPELHERLKSFACNYITMLEGDKIMTELQDKTADAFASADSRADDANRATVASREEVLWNDVAQRDVDLWAGQGVDVSITMDMLMGVSVAQRDKEWNDAMQAMIAVASLQARMESITREIIPSLFKWGIRREATRKGMSANEIKSAAVEGLSKLHHDQASERRKKPKGEDDV